MVQILKSKLTWRIRVTFAGKLPPKEYVTPDIRFNDPGWSSELFGRPIEQMEVFLPTCNKIVLAGMEQYNFFVEAIQTSGKRSSTQIEAFWFCGKPLNRNHVEMWRVGNSKVVRLHKAWGKEWDGGHTRGWKQGVSGQPISILTEVN